MADLAEELLSDVANKYLKVNTTDSGDDWDEKEQFFHKKDEYGISEYNGCKYLLYRTIGSSGVKVWDVLCLVPTVLFLIFLIYSSPRSRQKLSGAPFFFNAVHVLLFFTSAVSAVRCILMLMAPSPNDDNIATNMEKVTWSFTHAANLCLELTALVIFILPTLPSNKASKRILTVICILSFCFGFLITLIELRSPAKEFHVFSLSTNLFGDGGGIAILVLSLLSAIPYASLISIRFLQPKSSTGRRSSTFTYCIVMLGVQGTRALGGILLASDVEFGMCATNFTFYLLMEFLPPLVFMCVLCPYLHNRQGHSLLTQGYHTTEDDWLEDDRALFSQRNDPIGIMRRDQSLTNEDDYEL
eukprot:GFUD01005913.1.p1 GENE.GFUD01005913.1~~GFUD01005913.1.p1  ORF type:complete len:357 (-),score=50.50 GFUD01005913.1:57-1127(-)